MFLFTSVFSNGFKYTFKKYLNRLDSLGIVALIMIYMNPYIIFNLSFIFSYFMYLLIIFINRHKYLNLLLYIGSIPIILTIQYRINLLSFILGLS
ncbi:ComEC/Rec2 family competence protein [Coprobacillaceae bacterium CR2/5/TPMF4]|nr:ComEC/Rec2 family competence protein [Coprobacillaceae bacterium CR2/5/TPMF4]